MPKHKNEQARILELYRAGMTKTEFSDMLGISRPTYDAWLAGSEIGMKRLVHMCVDHIGELLGNLAIQLIEADDPRAVPCVCQTAIFDNGDCPKHGLSPIEEAERAFLEEVEA